MNLAEGSLEECRYYLILVQDLAYGDTSKLASAAAEVSPLLSCRYRPRNSCRYRPRNENFVLVVLASPLDSTHCGHGSFWLLTTDFHPAGISMAEPLAS